MEPFSSPRLTLRQLTLEDAAELLALLNSEGFLRHIGDKGVKTLEDARRYVLEGPMASYEAHGFGLWRVSTSQNDGFIGVCGFIRRPQLEEVDIGYALMPGCDGKGYGIEAARACVDKRHEFGIEKFVAVVSPANLASRRLLEKLGLVYVRDIPFGEPPQPTMLYQLLSD